MTVFVRGSNSGESGVDGFFLPRVTIVYEGRVELYFGGLQSGESSDDVQLRVGLGGVVGGEEERGGKAIKTESGCHCRDDVPRTSRSVVAMSPMVEKTAITKKRVPATTSS
jgi:hypothetical protein